MSDGVRPQRFYVESTAAWRDLADRDIEYPGARGALACALVTLCDAYEFARTFDDNETALSPVVASGDYGGDVVVYGLDGVPPSEPVLVEEVELFARRKTT